MADDPPVIPQAASMTVSEVTALVNLFNTQLALMEGRLVVKMDDNSKLATERWSKHDQELAKNTERVVARFEKLEKAVLTVEQALESHLDREHDEDVAAEARVKPLKGFIAWFWRNWRDLVLLLIGIVALATFITDFAGHALGLVPTP